MTSSFLKQATEGNKNAILKQQIICQYIFCGDSSITDLSKAVNLSVPTVTKLIGELIDEGFVHNFGEQGTAGGRRPNIYGLNPYAGYFVGVDPRVEPAHHGVAALAELFGRKGFVGAPDRGDLEIEGAVLLPFFEPCVKPPLFSLGRFVIQVLV